MRAGGEAQHRERAVLVFDRLRPVRRRTRGNGDLGLGDQFGHRAHQRQHMAHEVASEVAERAKTTAFVSHPPRPREVRVGGIILVIDPAEGKRAADRTIGDPPARRLECGTSQIVVAEHGGLARIGCGGRRHRLRIGKRQCHRLFQPDMFSGFQCCLGHRAVHAVGGGDRHHVHLRIGDSFLPMSGGAGKTELVRELLGAFRCGVGEDFEPVMRTAENGGDIAPGHCVAFAHKAGADQGDAKRTIRQSCSLYH
ncbi:hypothetical protein D3C71_1257240 [compost metagenome]